MRFVIEGVPYEVVAVDLLTGKDLDDVSGCDTRRHRIELLRGQSFEAALLALSREVCEAWLTAHDTPRTAAAFGEVADGLLVTFFDEFTWQGGRAAFAGLLGVPYEGNQAALERAEWGAMAAGERRQFILRNTVCAHLTHSQFEVFAARCDAAGLNPLRGDCWPALAYDAERRVLRVEARTTIKAIRRIGQASGHFAGVTTQEFSADGVAWSEVWADRERPPHAARCGVYRRGVERPIYAVCLLDNFAQFRERGTGRPSRASTGASAGPGCWASARKRRPTRARDPRVRRHLPRGVRGGRPGGGSERPRARTSRRRVGPTIGRVRVGRRRGAAERRRGPVEAQRLPRRLARRGSPRLS